MGVPTIVMAQNEREQLHRFAQMDNGFINLGLGSEVSDEDILSTFEWLAGAVSIRKEMHKLMLDNDLKSGINKVKRIILGETLWSKLVDRIKSGEFTLIAEIGVNYYDIAVQRGISNLDAAKLMCLRAADAASTL